MDLANEIDWCIWIGLSAREQASSCGCRRRKWLLWIDVCANWSSSGRGTSWYIGLDVAGGGGEDWEVRVKDYCLQEERD